MAVRELFELHGQVALVTGGSRGLGLQMALALGEMGGRIAICARREAELAEAAAEFDKRGIESFTTVADLAQPAQVPALVEAVVGRFGQIDVLVNNAGTSWGAPAEEMPLAAWDKVMRLNAGSVFQLSQLRSRSATTCAPRTTRFTRFPSGRENKSNPSSMTCALG